MPYLMTEENKKIVELINKKGSCGKVETIFDKLKLDDESFVVIYDTTDGPLWGAFIIDGKVNECGGTGHTTAGQLIKDRLIHENEFTG